MPRTIRGLNLDYRPSRAPAPDSDLRASEVLSRAISTAKSMDPRRRSHVLERLAWWALGADSGDLPKDSDPLATREFRRRLRRWYPEGMAAFLRDRAWGRHLAGHLRRIASSLRTTLTAPAIGVVPSIVAVLMVMMLWIGSEGPRTRPTGPARDVSAHVLREQLGRPSAREVASKHDRIAAASQSDLSQAVASKAWDAEPLPSATPQVPAALQQLAWSIDDGARRRGLAWIPARRELVVANYTTLQLEVWSEAGGLRAWSLSLDHLSDIAVCEDSVWAVAPRGILHEVSVSSVARIRSISIGDPGAAWLSNGSAPGGPGRIYSNRGGDGLTLVLDAASGGELGRWQLPTGYSFLDANATRLAVAHNSPHGGSELLAFTLTEKSVIPVAGVEICSFKGALSDVQVLSDGSVLCLAESAGLFLFSSDKLNPHEWKLSAFLPLQSIYSVYGHHSIERFAFAEHSELLALAHDSGLLVIRNPAWHKDGQELKAALEIWGSVSHSFRDAFPGDLAN